MNETTSIQKAGTINQSGVQKAAGGNPVGLAEGEQEFLTHLMQFMRGLKRSQERAVAQAAREWEGTIAYRIRLTMQERQRRMERRRTT